MALSAHIEELRRKHKVLSEAVEAEQKKPAPDGLAVLKLKKQKLFLKEEIGRLQLQ
ncbi:DUF465 domain-containing protein [Ketogulonicigenium vulgare]|uniref:DUF465 domain-containing protein n=1 Tax=Ketogulonicigenium vulgare (strain WSH-001) TaxID=759362 RepID=F9Y8F1_KETVW|nr:DUF465 domain-containing protein [Ketogulonicigenium vulgare]ADO41725.1 conserved hypothetical protein [Ketogulonicigenium vulgare Y25]AEM39960.1 hypothetical protein KVU_0121 [Ketogulonicigenium vulgare WSH-001]ALJ80169.1 hypothetical protein KVH_02650 [Ketogulonicigenium vulgare]ANW34887.1 DUF465 domain-containing protein [Ketogulonicigenium vulgare]AOZ53656.1 hypothetical protein KVC_0632 [Ketogulonicigenium vulgare]